MTVVNFSAEEKENKGGRSNAWCFTAYKDGKPWPNIINDKITYLVYQEVYIVELADAAVCL